MLFVAHILHGIITLDFMLLSYFMHEYPTDATIFQESETIYLYFITM